MTGREPEWDFGNSAHLVLMLCNVFILKKSIRLMDEILCMCVVPNLKVKSVLSKSLLQLGWWPLIMTISAAHHFPGHSAIWKPALRLNVSEDFWTNKALGGWVNKSAGLLSFRCKFNFLRYAFIFVNCAYVSNETFKCASDLPTIAGTFKACCDTLVSVY